MKQRPGSPSYDQFTVIILNINGLVIGMVNDSVWHVITLATEQVEPAPEMEGGIGHRLSDWSGHGRMADADIG